MKSCCHSQKGMYRSGSASSLRPAVVVHGMPCAAPAPARGGGGGVVGIDLLAGLPVVHPEVGDEVLQPGEGLRVERGGAERRRAASPGPLRGRRPRADEGGRPRAEDDGRRQ